MPEVAALGQRQGLEIDTVEMFEKRRIGQVIKRMADRRRKNAEERVLQTLEEMARCPVDRALKLLAQDSVEILHNDQEAPAMCGDKIGKAFARAYFKLALRLRRYRSLMCGLKL